MRQPRDIVVLLGPEDNKPDVEFIPGIGRCVVVDCTSTMKVRSGDRFIVPIDQAAAIATKLYDSELERALLLREGAEAGITAAAESANWFRLQWLDERRQHDLTRGLQNVASAAKELNDAGLTVEQVADALRRPTGISLKDMPNLKHAVEAIHAEAIQLHPIAPGMHQHYRTLERVEADRIAADDQDEPTTDLA